MRSGDIIQITDPADPWFPCLLIVSEVKLWGVQAYALIPTCNHGRESPGRAYRRLKTNIFTLVGSAVIIAGDKKVGT